jgi:hypothetical protein
MSDAHRVQSCGTFPLPLSPEAAFPLFTAEGERDWVPGWSPQILGELPQHPGLVFLTSARGSQTIWTVLETNVSTLTHRYSRVTPGHTAGVVEVRLRPRALGCEVTVSYDMTALSLEGGEALASYQGAAYTAMLGEWQELIDAALRDEALQPT